MGDYPVLLLFVTTFFLIPSTIGRYLTKSHYILILSDKAGLDLAQADSSLQDSESLYRREFLRVLGNEFIIFLVP